MACGAASRAMSSRARAARCRRRSPSTAPRSPASTGSPDPRHHRSARGNRHRADQPPRAAAGRGRRKLDPPGRRRPRQRRLRRHRRAPAPRSFDPGAPQTRACLTTVADIGGAAAAEGLRTTAFATPDGLRLPGRITSFLRCLCRRISTATVGWPES
jgi:hypothetical protein